MVERWERLFVRCFCLSSSFVKTGSMEQKKEIKEQDQEQKQSLSAHLTGSRSLMLLGGHPRLLLGKALCLLVDQGLCLFFTGDLCVLFDVGLFVGTMLLGGILGLHMLLFCGGVGLHWCGSSYKTYLLS